MKGTPAQIMARLGVMAGTLHGNRPYSNDGVRALYGRQPKRDFDGHNACIQCLSATTIKDCNRCMHGRKRNEIKQERCL